MKKAIARPPKVALCRMCKGTGIVATEAPQRYPEPCPPMRRQRQGYSEL